MKIIYDLGANNGDNIPYYLLKADKVIAVEANPILCDVMTSRFQSEIQNGRLLVENYVVTTTEVNEPNVSFYVHKKHHWLGQFLPPSNMDDFIEKVLPSKNIGDLIKEHGEPYYIKIDIEHYDHNIIRELFSLQVFPPYISAESHDVSIIGLLIASGQYSGFKLVDGRTVSRKYRNVNIATRNGSTSYSFPLHSAGPFAEDIEKGWYSASDFLAVLGLAGMGWKDIHATKLVTPKNLRYQQKVFLLGTIVAERFFATIRRNLNMPKIASRKLRYSLGLTRSGSKY